jgi:hypothetical protein
MIQPGRPQMIKKKKLDKLLIKSVDEALKEIFGEPATTIIYDYLQNNHSLKREEIPERLEDFERGLEKILSSGAWVAERAILKNLYSDFGLEYRNKVNYTFVDHVTKLKKQL